MKSKPLSAEAKPVVLRSLRLRDPLRWLLLGGRDFMRCPLIGLFYGACFTGMGWALSQVYAAEPPYVLALCAGFMLMAPFCCLGLYRVSQRLEQGEKPSFGDSLLAWGTRTGTLTIFGFVLLVLVMFWGSASMAMLEPISGGATGLRDMLPALLAPANRATVFGWLAVGAVFAGAVFAGSVVAMPMILHRRSDAITAIQTSLRLTLSQPLVMLCWGALLIVLAVLAMLPWFAGLLVIAPVLGHASWHAYRAAVAD